MAKARQSGPDLFDDVPDLDDLDDDAPPAAEAKTSKRAGKSWAELQCATCGQTYWVRYLKSEGLPTVRCCGRLYCDAVSNWTAEEWELRARSVHLHRPPLLPFTKLRPLSQMCRYCGSPMAVYTIPPTVHGDDRAACCTDPACSRLARTYRHEVTDSERIDAEALARWPSVSPGWLTGIVELVGPATRGHSGVCTPSEPAPPPSPPTPPESPPAAAEQERVATPADTPGLPVQTSTGAMREPKAGTPLVCQLIGRKDGHLLSKCGRRVRITDKTWGPPVAGMTAWDSQVSCEACRAATRWPEGTA